MGEPRAPLAKGLLPVPQYFPLNSERTERETEKEIVSQFCKKYLYNEEQKPE